MSGTAYRVLYDFVAEDDTQISLSAGAVVTVLDDSDVGGWFEGVSDTGHRGFFPGDYVQRLDDDYGSGSGSVQLTVEGETADEAKEGQRSPLTPQAVGESDAAAAPQIPRARRSFLAPTPKAASVYYQQPQFTPTGQEALKSPANANGQLELDTTTRYGVYASNMGVLSAIVSALCGVGLLIWAMYDSFYHVWIPVAFYALLLGAALVYLELKWGENRTNSKIPTRGILYTLATIPLFLTVPTTFAAACLVFTAAMQFLSTFMKESFSPRPQQKARPSWQTWVNYVLPCCFASPGSLWADGWTVWWARVKREDRVGEVVFLFNYTAANVIVWVYYLDYWWTKIDSAPPGGGFSLWVPFAKAFGSCIDLNTVLLLLPVSRTLIRWLYDHSTANQSLSSRALRALLWAFPLDKALEAHVMMGWVVVFHSVGHTVAHLFNYINAPGNTWEVFGATVWVTGGLLFVVMVFMYAAVFKNVKAFHFEIFWASHNIGFPLFYLLCIIHGKNTIGPTYWKWLLGPGIIYVFERLYREYKSRQPVTLLSATHMKPNVFCVELEKSGPIASYNEGQYVFLQCPHISEREWHPFTISSAPQEDTVTLHIRALGPDSWTRAFQEYLVLMGASKAVHTKFDRYEGSKRLPGKATGPDGRPLLKIYGPLSAPTQHLGEYSNAMIVASGIGVTPLASSLKSIVHHRWRYFLGDAYPNHAHFFWLCSHSALPEFRWFVRVVKEAVDAMLDMRAKQGDEVRSKTFSVHLFVTSYEEGKLHQQKVQEEFEEVKEDIEFWGLPTNEVRQQANMAADMRVVQGVKADWTEAQLYTALRCATKQPQHFGEDVHVYLGRPSWQDHFAFVAQQCPANDVGVLFCGNPKISADLREQCEHFSNDQRKFSLHKENF